MRDDAKYRQVIILMLPTEKRAAEEMAEAMHGAKRYLSKFIREAVAAKIADCKATLGICEYQGKQTRR